MTPCTCHPGTTCTSAASCAAARRVEFGETVTTTPAMPEPFAWAWRNKATGAKGVYFEDPKSFGITSHPDYEWTNLYTEAQALSTLQAQPAPTEHVKEPYTLAELNERIASNDYNAELLLQHAMLLLNAQPAEVSDEDLRAMWRQHGGMFHGPLIETGTMPEAKLLAFLRAILALRPQAESEPFGYFRALPFGWEQCSETDEGAVALYERPQSAQQAVQMTWPQTRDVGRFGDMSKSAHMRVGLDSDNDVYVSVWDEDGGGSVEFCNPGGGGGGSSRRTREALIALMVAMEADNAERPDKDWWARRNGITAPAGGEG